MPVSREALKWTARASRTDSGHTPNTHPTLALVWFITELDHRGVGKVDSNTPRILQIN